MKAKEPSRTQEHPLPLHCCALTPWKTHLGPAVQKAKATADSRKEAGKTPASPSGAWRDLGKGLEPHASGQARAALAVCPQLQQPCPDSNGDKASRWECGDKASSWDCGAHSVLGDLSHCRGCDATKGMSLNPPWQDTGSRFSPFSIPWALAQSGASWIAPNTNFAWRRSKHKSPGTHHLL